MNKQEIAQQLQANYADFARLFRSLSEAEYRPEVCHTFEVCHTLYHAKNN